jgi:hypothetical protein
MERTRCGWWTALALAAASGHVQAAEGPRPVLRATWVDVDLPLYAFDAMARESASILHDLGVDLVWGREDTGPLPEDSDVTIILLNSRPRSPALSSRSMGAVVPHSTPRAVWLYFPNVAWALGVDGKRGPRSAAEVWDLGVALGRVAAHELVHAFAPEVPHASHGLMVETMGRSHLLGPRMGLDEPARRALLSRLGARQTAQAGR